MLIGKHGCRHKHRNLFAVGGGLECGTHGYFGFPEPDIPAYQSIHRARALHILFHCGSGS